MNIIITLLSLLIIFSVTILSCNSEQNIIDEWKRIKGGSEGLIVNVIKEKDYDLKSQLPYPITIF